MAKELPPDIAEFTGREEDLRFLREQVPQPGARRTAPVIVTLHGAPGTGKSVLAIHFAREVESRFPDAQLYVDLRGTGARPLEPLEALSRLVRGLGVGGPDLPTDLDGLSREYRQGLRGRRALVVLDNAASVSQVQPLLPGGPGCLVLVTSRQPLNGLISGSRHRLDVMSQREAVTLLGKIAGEGVVSGENRDGAERLARLCGHLPLALSIAGVQLRSHPVAEVVSRLEDERGRLEELHSGLVGVRASFDVTYEQLSEGERRLFRRLRLLPEPSFGAEMAAALLVCPAEQATELLERLVEEQVLERVGDSRYGFNELIGLYAGEKLEREEPAGEGRAASGRALGVYLGEAMELAVVLDPSIRELGGVPARGGVGVDEQVAALEWFERERPRLARVWRLASEIGAHEVVWKLAASLVPFFDLRGHRGDWSELQEAALRAARESGDLEARVWARLGLGHLRWLERRGEDALSDLEEALESASAGGWPRLRARALHLIGRVEHENQRPEEALARYDRAAAIFHDEGMLHEQASAIFHTGTALTELGVIATEDALRLGEQVLGTLATMPPELWVERATGRTREFLGRVAEAAGDLEAAGSSYIGSGQAFRRIGFRHGQARALRALGRVRMAQRSWTQAREFLEDSLALFRAIGDRYDEGLTLLLAGEAQVGLRNRTEAEARWLEAHSLLSQLDAPEAARADQLLDTLRVGRRT